MDGSKGQPVEKPSVIISQCDRPNRDPNGYFPAADFVLVVGDSLQVWVDGTRFIEDPDGEVRPGQYVLVRDPGFGVMISRIESLETGGDSATVRHLVHWMDGELLRPNETETWSHEEITGEYDRSMGDASIATFLERTT